MIQKGILYALFFAYISDAFHVSSIFGRYKTNLSMKALPDLTGNTLWRLSLKLKKDSMENNALLRVRFVPDRGYGK